MAAIPGAARSLQAHLDLDTKRWSYDTVVSSVASQPLRDVITGPWAHTGDLACAALDLQIKLHEEALADAQGRTSTAEPSSTTEPGTRNVSLFEAAAAKIAQSIGADDGDPNADLEAINSLPPAVVARAFGSGWERLPYHAFCASRAQVASGASELPSGSLFGVDVDEWILKNESWLRDDRKRDWRWGLVKYSAHADTVFPRSTPANGVRAVQRVEVDGRTILDYHRAKLIELQPTIEAFKHSFDTLTGGLLKGLDWNNVFVAGGMPLSSLLCTDLEKDAEKYKNSDIDVYIYGLNPVEANKKVEQLYKTWLSNLPPNQEPHVLRNSRTITFMSKYPGKRIQIVLKLVSNPKEVLLNFDLDPCSLGYDGEELWLLPRAARSLQTGYTDFTMDLIQGHYLGQRRASQQQRVFKYADKGFGIRFRPSYIESLSRYFTNVEKPPQATPDFDAIAAESREWLDRLIRVRYPSEIPTMTHEDITERKQRSSDPAGRSALQGYGRLMRHVALWERACMGDIVLDTSHFAYANYDDELSPLGYDEAPQYEWGPNFKFSEFSDTLKRINWDEGYQAQRNLEEGRIDLPIADRNIWRSFRRGEEPDSQSFNVQPKTIRRLVLAETLDEVLSSKGDSMIPVAVPMNVVEKCNQLVLDALNDHGLPSSQPLLIPLLKPSFQRPMSSRGSPGEDLVPMIWHIDAIRAWQLIDRRIDEVYEILWAFRAANVHVEAEIVDRTDLLIAQLSKRAIRANLEDEYVAFGRWITRVPNRIGFSYAGAWYNTPGQDDDENDLDW